MSSKERHRDREPKAQYQDQLDAPSADRAFRMTDAQRQEIAQCLQYIDDARRELEAQQNRENREIVRELRASADRIFDLLNGLEDIGD